MRRGGQGEDMGFYPQGGGNPGGLWAGEKPDLTQVFTDALQLPQGECIEEGVQWPRGDQSQLSHSLCVPRQVNSLSELSFLTC